MPHPRHQSHSAKSRGVEPRVRSRHSESAASPQRGAVLFLRSLFKCSAAIYRSCRRPQTGAARRRLAWPVKTFWRTVSTAPTAPAVPTALRRVLPRLVKAQYSTARCAAEHPAAQDIFHLYPPAVIACGWPSRPPVPDPPGKNSSTPLPAVPPHQAHLALGSRSPLLCRRWRATLHLRKDRQSLQLGPAARAACPASHASSLPAICTRA